MSGFGWRKMTFGQKVLTVILFVPVFCLGKAISYAAGRSQLKKQSV